MTNRKANTKRFSSRMTNFILFPATIRLVIDCTDFHYYYYLISANTDYMPVCLGSKSNMNLQKSHVI
jgi:hypothetical protein